MRSKGACPVMVLKFGKTKKFKLKEEQNKINIFRILTLKVKNLEKATELPKYTENAILRNILNKCQACAMHFSTKF